MFFIVGVMVKDIFPELRLDVPNIEKQIAPNMLCLRDIEVLLKKKISVVVVYRWWMPTRLEP